MDSIDSGVMADLKRVKAGSYSQVSGDVLDHVLYDTLQFAATTVRPTSSFFTTPIGGTYGTGTKSKNETNMTDPGKLPAGQGFLIKEIGFAFPELAGIAVANAVDLIQAFTNIVQNSIFEIRIAGREFDLQFPGTMLMPAMMNRATGTVSATLASIPVGDYLASGWMKLAAPIILGELVSFSVVQITGSATAAVTTLLNTASNTLNTAGSVLQMKLRGTLVRSK